MGNRKGFSIFVLTVLSFSAVSSLSVIPRISRTGDAVIIDFADQDVAPYQEKDVYSEVADPEYVPVPPQFNPYPMVFQQHTRNSNGWSYFYGYPSLVAPAFPAADPSVRQSEDYEGELEEDLSEIQLEKQAPAPAPATCGRGPAAVPATRTSIAGRISYPAPYTATATAKKGAWPFMVALRKTGEAAAFCAGSLISDTRVVLAAQCLEKLSVFEISGVTVLVGMHKSDFSDVQMTRRISKVIIHSAYNAATYANDIAVIIMDSPVVLSKTVAPICLPAQSADPDQFIDQNAMILGWNPGAGGTGTTLEQALVAISANGDCRADVTFGQFVSDSTSCVTSADKFTCTKDVGGPVVIGVPPAAPATTPVTWTLVGINSYTLDCTKGGLKTRVAAFRTWIDKAI